ncbi:DUF7504 family protein [Haladaptatus salinisoli]|uniref:DUF7504 family protein n=1 Tax=Haladaptatus salinisoli TaxID=2884876 RepID=UPI001D0B40E5|nr:HalOD1 output domain-containing protein [Haladaptatus salinisoli]
MDGEDGSGRSSESGVTKVHEPNAWRSDRMLGTTVVETVAEAAGVTPADIEVPLYDVIDPDALDALFAPRPDGRDRTAGTVSFALHGHYVTVSADGVVEVESELARIKQTGGNLLLTGLVPDRVVDAVSVQLLGRDDPDRTQVVALHDRNVTTANRRLSGVGTASNGGYVLNFSAEARSAVSGTPDASASTDRRVTEVVGDLFDFQREIDRTLRKIDYERRGMDPAELRFCFDSLRPVVDEHGEGDAKQFLEDCFDTVEDLSGVAHYVLPAERNTPEVAAIEPLFDATVELRVGEIGPEQRWHLPDTEFTTDWFGLELE